jgi:hypothetical protein
MTTSITVSRRQHDQLLQRYPAFMATDWPKMAKDWFVYGVEVSGSNHPGLLHALRCNLANLPKEAKA